MTDIAFNPSGTEMLVISVLLGLSFIETLFLVYFIVVEETLKVGHVVTLKRISTPFNVSLFAMGLSLLSLIASEVCLLLGAQKDIVVTAEDCFFSTYQVGYIIYSYQRAKGLLSTILPTYVTLFVWSLVQISPLLFYAQVIPDAIILIDGKSTKLDEIGHIISIAGGCVLLFLDLLFLSVFIIFIYSARLPNSTKPDNRFLIVSKYGSIASLLVVLALVMFSLLSDVHEHWFISSSVFFQLLYLDLLVMKIELHRDKMGKLRSANDSTAEARRKTRSTSTRQEGEVESGDK
ncbi:hypothetical protein BCR33DRAFT_418255 [Rhizoclosmatium globosum]|uniref:Uncharacterized protein n=1 Tax=Rhizoclosmatium globosum TaxID=329046 RepID=A0A1Y2BWJ0_9FUNG|nr:hypothetical protein BCR33DRAFT_418255 [Rhizoclosmatium globosum]|eukprot:ORY39118.1 hypothetical protein BCR33DRAFT_418255 [Rhizoclosmatium globosum]